MTTTPKNKATSQKKQATPTKKKKNFIPWMLVTFFVLSAAAFMPSYSAIVFILLAIAILPVKPMKRAWKKMPRAIKPVTLIALFVLGVAITPTSDSDSPADSTVTQHIVETSEPLPTTEPVPVESVVSAGTESIPSVSSIPEEQQSPAAPTSSAVTLNLSDIPAYSGQPFIEINNNVPYFFDSEYTTTSFETYSDLDNLGRCGIAYACIGQDIMPTEKRGEIGSIKPSGWHTIKYNDIIDGNYLYNRCHLIGFQLSGENTNAKNLITGTRYMNVSGMLPFENMVADYVKETNNHVLYRVTPVFEQDNLVVSGVQMEAKSMEDNGEGILFNVFCYNVQPGIYIDYATGDSAEDGSMNVTPKATLEPTPQPSATATAAPPPPAPSGSSYAVNANNGKIHIVGGCPATKNGKNAMKNPVYFDTYEEAENYSISIAPDLDKRKCGNCW